MERGLLCFCGFPARRGYLRTGWTPIPPSPGMALIGVPTLLADNRCSSCHRILQHLCHSPQPFLPALLPNKCRLPIVSMAQRDPIPLIYSCRIEGWLGGCYPRRIGRWEGYSPKSSSHNGT